MTPLWRWIAVGGLFASLAGYALVTGEIGIDKRGAMVITRAAQPGAYWLIVAVSAILGALCLHKAWRQITSP